MNKELRLHCIKACSKAVTLVKLTAASINSTNFFKSSCYRAQFFEQIRLNNIP